MVPAADRRLSRTVGVAAAVLLAAAPAKAHAPIADAGAFYGGLLHPLTDAEAIPALLAIGLLAGQAGSERGALAALAAAAAALVGGLLAIGVGWSVEMPAMVAVGTLITALLVTADLRLPRSLLLAVTGTAGAAIGVTQGGALGSILAMAGAALGIMLALLYIAAITARIGPRWLKIGVRVAGSWLAAITFMLLGLQWR